MNKDIAIKVENLSKVYKLYNAPIDRMKEALNPFKKKYHIDYHALNNVSFEIKKGETIGIIGRNGAGKSTILKIITGVLSPSSGSVVVDGRISALLELGAGFNPDYTGLDNIFFQGNLMGMSHEEVREKVPLIIDFADIGEFIFQPVKIYSSGMFARLAFAVSIHVTPDILIVDEALSVGDASFGQKCVKKMDEFKESGGTVVFVSHDMGSVKQICDRAILLNKGGLLDIGDTESVVNRYYFEISKDSGTNVNSSIKIDGKRVEHGTRQAEILEVSLINADKHINVVSAGEFAKIIVKFKANETVDSVNVGIMIRDKYGQDVFGTNTELNNIVLDIKSGCVYEVHYDAVINIGVGKFTISPAIVVGLTHYDNCLHWVDNFIEFEVLPNKKRHFEGICFMDVDVSYREIENV